MVRVFKKYSVVVIVLFSLILSACGSSSNSATKAEKKEVKRLQEYFHILDQSRKKDLVLVTYKYQLTGKDDDKWVTVLLSGFTLAQHYAYPGDMLAVSVEFKGGHSQAYRTSYENMSKLILEEISHAEFIKNIEVYTIPD